MVCTVFNHSVFDLIFTNAIPINTALGGHSIMEKSAQPTIYFNPPLPYGQIESSARRVNTENNISDFTFSLTVRR